MACELSVAPSTNMAWSRTDDGPTWACRCSGAPPDTQKLPIHVAVQMEFEVAAPLSELVPGACTLALRTADD